MDIKNRLRQLDKTPSKAPGPADRRSDTLSDLAELARLLRGRVIEIGGQELIISEHRTPLDTLHGRTRLKHIDHATGEVLHIAARKRIKSDFSLRHALFVDTETTGLAGGAGTYVFLLGLGFCEGDEFVVEQIFLPDPGRETAMLMLLKKRLTHRRGLVSFNGKSYDIPLLTARFIQNRMHPEIDLHQHFDVLHAARRLWQRDFGSCSLTNLERHICGIRREGDIPGEEIPGIYADFLRTGSAPLLANVLYHNRMDILTLLALSIEIAHRYREAGRSQSISEAELERIGRLFLSMQAPEKAAELFSALLRQTGLSSTQQRSRLLHYAQAQKSLRNHERAKDAWQQVLAEHGFSFEACIELAKLFEHKERNYALALQMTERALRVAETRQRLNKQAADRHLMRELQHRRKRLLRKLNPGDPSPTE